MNYKQVSRQLNITQTSKKKIIAKVLFELEAKEALVEEKPGKFKLINHESNLNKLVGKVDMTTSGSGYVEVEGLPNDIYIGEKDLGIALHGDLVEVAILRVKRNGKPIGKVIEVLERAKTEFVGTLQKSAKFAFLVPDSKRMTVDLFIPLDKLNGAKDGEKVIAKLTHWPSDTDSPFGEIIQVLGKPGENETEMHSILAEYGLPIKFPDGIEAAAENLDVSIKESEIKKRKRPTKSYDVHH